MNVYDFDRTIFRGNSLQRFCFYSILRLPYLLLLLPYLVVVLILHGIRVLDKDHFFRCLEVYLVLVPNKEKRLEKFWDKKIGEIKDWYLQQKQPTDVILSATPQIVVEKACKRLGVNCIATQGKVHCYGQKKVDYFRKQYGDVIPDAFYSDSYSDIPMFKYCRKGYLVKHSQVTLCYENGKSLFDIDEAKYMKKYK